MRAWSWPVRRPSRTTRLRSSPGLVARSQAVRPSLAAPRLDRLAQLVDALGGEDVVLDVVDQVEAAGAVEAEHELAALVLAERVLELVAVAELLDGGHDRLDRRRLEAADALERVAHLRLLLLELALVGEHLPGRARVRRRAARSARGSARAARPSRPPPNERFDFVIARPHAVARHRAAHEHDVARRVRATPAPPWASRSIVSSSSSPAAAGAWSGRLSTRLCSQAGRRSQPRAATELRLDRVQHRLAVRVAALVVAHLAQLRRREVGQAA